MYLRSVAATALIGATLAVAHAMIVAAAGISGSATGAVQVPLSQQPCSEPGCSLTGTAHGDSGTSAQPIPPRRHKLSQTDRLPRMSAKEVAWLTALRNSTNGTGWQLRPGTEWVGDDPCNDRWAGVNCNEADTSIPLGCLTSLVISDSTVGFSGTLPDEWLDTDNYAAPYLTLLQIGHVDLHGELKAGIFRGAPSITMLDISDTSVSSIVNGSFVGMRYVSQVSLMHMNVSYLPPGWATGLGPSLVSLHMGAITGGRPLPMYEGFFSPIELIRSLTINIGDAMFMSLPVIPTGAFDNLAIAELDLSDLAVERVEPGAFRSTIELESLHLDGNKLNVIEPGLLQGIETLESLYVSNNNISALRAGALDGAPDLHRLYLDGNPLGFVEHTVLSSVPKLSDLRVDKVPCDIAGRMAVAWAGGVSVCSDCKPGYQCPRGGHAAQQCPPGTFSPGWGNTACNLCPPGTFNDQEGIDSQSGCTFCPVGTSSAFLAATTAQACTQCPPGSFAAGIGSAECTSCPHGTYVAENGATSSAWCGVCPVVRFSSDTNSSELGDLDAGHEDAPVATLRHLLAGWHLGVIASALGCLVVGSMLLFTCIPQRYATMLDGLMSLAHYVEDGEAPRRRKTRQGAFCSTSALVLSVAAVTILSGQYISPSNVLSTSALIPVTGSVAVTEVRGFINLENVPSRTCETAPHGALYLDLSGSWRRSGLLHSSTAYHAADRICTLNFTSWGPVDVGSASVASVFIDSRGLKSVSEWTQMLPSRVDFSFTSYSDAGEGLTSVNGSIAPPERFIPPAAATPVESVPIFAGSSHCSLESYPARVTDTAKGYSSRGVHIAGASCAACGAQQSDLRDANLPSGVGFQFAFDLTSSLELSTTRDVRVSVTSFVSQLLSTVVGIVGLHVGLFKAGSWLTQVHCVRAVVERCASRPRHAGRFNSHATDATFQSYMDLGGKESFGIGAEMSGRRRRH